MYSTKRIIYFQKQMNREFIFVRARTLTNLPRWQIPNALDQLNSRELNHLLVPLYLRLPRKSTRIPFRIYYHRYRYSQNILLYSALNFSFNNVQIYDVLRGITNRQHKNCSHYGSARFQFHTNSFYGSSVNKNNLICVLGSFFSWGGV